MSTSARAEAADCPARIEFAGISKSFGGVQALKGVDVTVLPGEVHGLLGENGSGKSTLIKVLAGFHMPDTGTLRVDGELEAMPLSADRLAELGIAFVHQDLGLIDSLTITENLLLGEISTRHGAFLSLRREHRRAKELLATHGVFVRVETQIGRLTAFERAMVAIVRALNAISVVRGEPRGLLVLDEAMAFLADHERTLLKATIRSLAKAGTSVLLVSHDLDDVLSTCDTITVLRDGAVVGNVQGANGNRGDLAELIVGHPVVAAPVSPLTRPGLPEIRLRDVSSSGVKSLSLDIALGDVVGLTGLVGEGYAEILYVLYGAVRGSGTLRILDRTYRLETMDPPKALMAGIALVPGDRHRHGGVLSLTLGENVSLPRLNEFWSAGFIRTRALAAEARAQLEQFDVRPAVPSRELGSLSGGNQQKAVIAKWLQLRPRLLLLDEPTIGVDVGARAEIFSQIHDLARSGAAVICASSDYAQLAELCNRVFIFAGSECRAELTGESLSREEILSKCLLLGGTGEANQPKN
jgi:ribose transport system ATP-binding protein